ncbi:cache domain-containing sensor histidine kinase [Paenibacillus sp. IITD108]|uniref:cache domain-containing sensor histidine kinase n=1 Tax=Paenibacillus sp. IITD108 TaxID=3116649 RepID=UPI002F41F0C6
MSNTVTLLRAVRNFKFRSLFVKSLLLIFFLVVIPFSAMTYIIYKQMDRAMQSETSTVSQNNLMRVRDVVDTIFYQMNHISLELINQEDVNRFLLQEDEKNFSSLQYQNIYDKISMYTRTYTFTDSVYIYSDTNRYIISNRGSRLLDDFDDATWHSQVFGPIAGNDPIVQLRLRNDIYPYYISFTRPAYYFGQKIGAVTTNIDIEELRKFLNRNTLLHSEYLYIINDRNEIMYSHQRDDFMKNMKEVPLLSGIAWPHAAFSSIQKIDGQNYIVTHLLPDDESKPWTYLLLVPLSQYDQKVQQLYWFIFLFFGAGVFVLLAVSIFISIKTLSPVNQIMSFLEGQDRLGYAMEWSERKHLNELKYIIQSIFRTMNAKNILQEELELRQQLLNKAHTTALQAQINPHFLYNTLESIKFLAIGLTKGHNQVSHSITLLSDILRYGLDSDQPVTTISQEAAYARTYLELMKLRYPRHFEVDWQIDPETLSNVIIKFSLQPLLENALNHGILPSRKAGVITIESVQIESETGELATEVAISDNGKGIAEEELLQLNRILQENYNLDEQHIGIKNVNQRIKLIFGEGWGVSVSSSIDAGTTIRMRLPHKGSLSPHE